MARILLPAFTVARWGGLHEFVVDAVRTLTLAGHEVTAVVKNDPIADRVKEAGGDVEIIEWDNWRKHSRIISRRKQYDLVFAQPFRSRQLGQEVCRIQSIPLVAMIHGFNPDHAFAWQDECAGYFATTESIAELLYGVCRVPSSKVTVVPNAVANDRFDLEPRTFSEKILGGKALISVVSRIDRDKRSQVEVIRELVPYLERTGGELDWTIQFLGDGLERVRVEEQMRQQTVGINNVQVVFKGWVDPEDVPRQLAESFFSVSAGRGAMQSLAVGTPCFAAGARGVGGLQAGSNLEVGLRSNFADYPMAHQRLADVGTDLELLMDPAAYHRIQSAGRSEMWHKRSQDVIEKLLVESVESFLL